MKERLLLSTQKCKKKNKCKSLQLTISSLDKKHMTRAFDFPLDVCYHGNIISWSVCLKYITENMFEMY